jgi:predicted nucleotidyltransferase
VGISLDKNARIAGYRPSAFKDALRGFLRTHSPGNMIDLKTAFPLRRDGAIVFEECLDRGLIDPATTKLTEAGEAIARAKAKSRTPLAKAQSVLNEFLDRIEIFGRDPDGVQDVDQVWLFGSLMRGEDSVGDIDLAITKSRRPRFAHDHEGRQSHVDQLVAQRADAPRYWDWPWAKEDWLVNRALYGAKRHPLLVGVQEGTSDLQSLGVPCRLIYDRSRGGRVDDPILPRHPESRGRSNDLSPPAEMPDLTPAPVRPMDARWVAGFWEVGVVSPYDIFRGWTNDAHALFPRYPDGLRVVGDDHNLSHYPWTPKRLKKPGLDGRNAVALISATEWWGTSLTLRRHIEVSPSSWTLRAGFSDLQLYRARKYADWATLQDLAAVAALILAVDAERMLRRTSELLQPPTVRIAIDDDGLTDDIRPDFVEPLRAHLAERTIRIEPPDWTGEKVVLI